MDLSGAPAQDSVFLDGMARLAYELDGVVAYLAALDAEASRLRTEIAAARARLDALERQANDRYEAEEADLARMAADMQADIARLEREFEVAADRLRLDAAAEAARILDAARQPVDGSAAARSVEARP